MNDEIKEILNNINYKYKDYYVQDIVSGDDLKLLSDYITNLQEENEELKDQKKKAIEYINNLREESAERQEFYYCYPDDLYIPSIDDLLKILGGDE